MVEIYPSIKVLRLKHGLTQNQVAAKLNCSVPAYSKLETGATDLTHTRLRQLAALYNIMTFQIYQPAAPGDNSLGEKDEGLKQQNPES